MRGEFDGTQTQVPDFPVGNPWNTAEAVVARFKLGLQALRVNHVIITVFLASFAAILGNKMLTLEIFQMISDDP